MIETNTPEVLILLATHNGERYLREQLDSILNQSFNAWTLLVRDDASSDRTPDILSEYARLDSRIRILRDKKTAGSAVRNFSILSQEALILNSNYFFFCDQDDIWQRDKMEIQLKALAEVSEGEPLLVHHDLRVVDAEGRETSPSFHRLLKRNLEQADFSDLLSLNQVTGCTMACNRALLEIASPIPANVIMHDWWLALVCAALGSVRVLGEPLVDYRQHGANVIGAKGFWYGLNPRLNLYKTWMKGIREFLATVEQAHILKARLEALGKMDSLPQSRKSALVNYINLMGMPRLKRLRVASTQGYCRSHWFLKLLNRLRLIILPRQKI